MLCKAKCTSSTGNFLSKCTHSWDILSQRIMPFEGNSGHLYSHQAAVDFCLQPSLKKNQWFVECTHEHKYASGCYHVFVFVFSLADCWAVALHRLKAYVMGKLSSWLHFVCKSPGLAEDFVFTVSSARSHRTESQGKCPVADEVLPHWHPCFWYSAHFLLPSL